MKLSKEEILFYKKNGFLKSSKAMFEGETLEKLTRLSRSIVNRKADIDTPVHVYDLVQKFPEFLDYIAHKDVLDSIQTIIGPDIGLFTASALIKMPGSDSHFKWHSDFFQIEHFEEICKIDSTVMLLAIDETNEENGCVQYIPESQERRRRRYNSLQADAADYRNSTRHSNHGLVESEVDFSKGVVKIELPKGYCSFHDIHSVHASEKNMSSRERIVLCFIYFSTNVSALKPEAIDYLQVDKKLKMHLRGEDKFNICRYSLFKK